MLLGALIMADLPPLFAGIPKNLLSKKVKTYNYPVPELRLKNEIRIQPAELAELQDLDERLDLDADSGGDDMIPADDLYQIWNNLQVNPYKIASDSILGSDSVEISLAGFVYPLATNYHVTSEFGQRRRRYHNGIDLKVYRGDSILSVMDGVVRIAKRVGGYGNLVAIRHYNGLETFYGHLSKLLVKSDQTVKAGELIGYGGSTGRSTGAHLHFELRYLGQCINPRDLIDFDSLRTKSDMVVLTQKNFDHRKRLTSTGSNGKKVWLVRNGDSLGLIAKRTKTSVNYLCSVNGITSKTVIRPGRKIYY